MQPIELTEATFDEAIASDTPILVDFWAAWCGPCRAMAPILDEVAAEQDGRLRVGKVNVDENRGLAQRFQIASIPLMILFKSGQPVTQVLGARPKENLMGAIEQYL